MSEDKRNRDERDWTDTVADALGALGFNRNRIRWKLHIWQNERQKRQRQGEQRMDHIRYQHKICSECGAVQDRDAKVCTRCESPMSHRRWHVLRRLGLSSPVALSMSSLLGVLIVIAYARLIFASGGGGILSMDIGVVLQHGGQFRPALDAGDWWRLGTPIFLHFGLWHLGFNLFALAVVGPRVEELYGGWHMLFLFMLTGVVGNAASAMWGPYGVGAGASGAVMGLIGVAAAWGHLQGTSYGRTLRNDMLKWTAYTVIFGFAIGADNVAHLAGFASGAVIAIALPPRRLKHPRLKPLRIALGAVAMIACLGFAAATLFPPESNLAGIGQQRAAWGDARPRSVDPKQQADIVNRKIIDPCNDLIARNPELARRVLAGGRFDDTPDAAACATAREIVLGCKREAWPFCSMLHQLALPVTD